MSTEGLGNFARMAQRKKDGNREVDSGAGITETAPNIDVVVKKSIPDTSSVGRVMVERMADSEADESARIISLNLIDPDPEQPRATFKDIEEKAKTIKEHGLLHPIVVRPHPTVPGRFMIIDGERRWRAYSQILSKEDPLEFSEIRVTVKVDVNDIGKLRLMQLLANIQRDELNPIEEAEALAVIKKLNGYHTNKELARAVGKSETRISRALKLLKLSPEEKTQVASGELSAREIQNNRGTEAARDGRASKTPRVGGVGEGGQKTRVAKVSISLATANNLALILKSLATQHQLADIVLDDMSKKELIAILEARSADVLEHVDSCP